MMGGGFGGSTLNLVRRNAVKTFSKQVSEGYMRATGISSTIIATGADDGVRELRPLEEQLYGDVRGVQ
jgi:galactokinase